MKRRDFIKKALATGVVATVAPSLAASAFPSVAASVGKGKKSSIGNEKMKLTFWRADAALAHPFTVSGYTRTHTPIVLTKIEYGGYEGYGEAAMPPYLGETSESAMAFLSRIQPILDKYPSPFLLEDILFEVDNLTTFNTAAKASIDIALHDLVGKLIGQPWYNIWGYDRMKAPDTSFTIGIDTPEVVREKTKEAAPYNLIKVKLGTPQDEELVGAIRSVEPTKPLCVDANQGWKDKHHALEMIHWCKEHGFIFIEQPIGKYNLDDMAWITQNSPLPTIADESCQRLIDVPKLKGVFSGINIKLMKCTGMREANKMVSLARTLNMKVMIGCMTETSCAISAASHVACACDWADLDGNVLIAHSSDPYDGMKVVDGKVIPSDRPGIGIVKRTDL
ncbi:MAG: dipeptide epimerase [Rikenellaceae bacterium]|nr:dipeptide epimerase [Rikenellaceae bacterium]